MVKKSGKVKKEKPPPNLEPEFSLTKEELAAFPKKKKKTKNAPDKPQPAWLHPPDEENPVLNPKPKDEETRKRQKEEHDASIEYLQRRSVGAPMRPAPPGILINLVGAFLSSFGFDNASRLYTAQLRSREKLGDWKTEHGKGLPKNYPSLLRIFNEFHGKWESEHRHDSPESEAEKKPSKKSKKKSVDVVDAKLSEKNDSSDEGTSSSGSSDTDENSDDSSDSSDSDSDNEKSGVDIEMPDAPSLAKPQRSVEPTTNKTAAQTSLPDVNPTSSSKPGVSLLPPSAPSQPTTAKTNVLEDATSSSSSSDSDSSSDNGAGNTADDSPEKSFLTAPEGRSPEKSRTTSDSSSTLDVPSALKPSATSSPPSSPSSSSGSSSPSSSASSQNAVAPSPTSKPADTSTINISATTTKRPASTSLSPTPSTSDSDSATGTTPHTSKRAKIEKDAEKNGQKSSTTSERWQRIPSDTKIDPRLASNEYVPHAYGEQAHTELSVTRGKGFTKEKNKKKRGSYRGGTIGVEGGGGVRFAD